MFNPEIAVQISIVLAVLAAAYLALVRPQLQRLNEHNQLVASLKIGDRIVTCGGLVGRIAQFDDGDIVQIDLSDSIRVPVLRTRIEQRLSPV